MLPLIKTKLTRTAAAVLACSVMSLFPPLVTAALGVGNVWFTSLGGSVGLGYENRETSLGGADRGSQKYDTGIDLNTDGVVWDYRFLKFKAGVSLSNEQTTSDRRSSDRLVTGFRFSSTLFPVWRYPYGPIYINASKNLSTTESDGGGSNEVENTFLGLRWRLFQKQLGRIKTSYSLRFHEATPASSEERDETKHEFTIDAERRFREGQWGSSRVQYGYEFESLEDAADGTSSIKHDLYVRDHTELGDKVDFNGGADLYYSKQDGGGASGESSFDSNLFTTTANLQIRQTERFRHYYSLAASRQEFAERESTTTTGSAGATYRYPHVFNDYLTGSFSTSGGLNMAHRSQGDATSALNGSANGGLRYSRTFGDFRTYASYTLNLSHSLSSQSNNSDAPRIGQYATAGYVRLNNPFFQDKASVHARLNYHDDLNQNYSIRYQVDSNINQKNLLTASVNASMSQPEGGNSFGANAGWRSRLSQTGHLNVTASSNWRNSDKNDRQSTRIEIRYRDRFILGRPVSVNSFIRQEYETFDTDDEEDRLKAGVDMGYRIGKIRLSLSYDYELTETGAYEETDQILRLSVRRYFGVRL